jgi:FkbM family methyltransferase
VTEFKRTQEMHQFYRDSLVKTYFFDEFGEIPRETINALIESNSCDTLLCAETLFPLNSGLPADRDLALKQMLMLITQSNLSMDKHRDGLQTPLPKAYKKSIRDGLMRLLKTVPSVKYLINAIQILYRIGEIDDAMSLVRKNEKVVDSSLHLQQIVAMIYTMEERFEEAIPYLLKLVESGAHQTNSMIKLMSMTCMYKLGALPDEPVDFATLAKIAQPATSEFPYQWVIAPNSNKRTKPTLLIACDDQYFYEHALALLYSVADHNTGDMMVHFHLYTPNASVVAFTKALTTKYPLLEITASIEHIDLKSPTKIVEFTTRRFAVSKALLAHFNSPVILLDADALWRKPWRNSLAQSADNHDVIVYQPKAAPFWENVAAGFVYLNNTDAAKYYIAQVVEFIEDNLSKGKHLWFLDQIALSACHYEAQQKQWGTRFAPIEPNELMDVNHGDQAVVWVITNQKHADGFYAQYKSELQIRHGQMPYSQPNDAFMSISVNKMPVQFLQVGAMDGVSYDPIHSFIRQFGWQGVLVEPLPDMLERARNNYKGCDGLIFENIAITEQFETKKLYRIEPETIIKNKLPDWLKGMSTFSETKLNNYQPFVSVVEVDCMPLMKLIERNQFTKIDILQIDTEGYDYKVFKQLDFNIFKPTLINLEIVNLNPKELELLEKDLMQQNYYFYRYEFDMIAIQKSWFHNPQ